MSSLSDLFDRLDLAESTPHDATAALVADLKLNARQREFLAPLVLAWCCNIERHRVRHVEHRAELQLLRGDNQRAGVVVNRTTERQALMIETFTLGNGQRVAWGSATAQDHRDRVAYLCKLRDGYQSTIDRHLAAIEAIEAAGVTCLAQVQAA